MATTENRVSESTMRRPLKAAHTNGGRDSHFMFLSLQRLKEKNQRPERQEAAFG